MSCNICEVETILFCPHCESRARYDTRGRESGEVTCADCSGKFQWISDHKLMMEPAKDMRKYDVSHAYIPDPGGSGVNKEPVREPVDCPACKSVTTTKEIYQFHHDFNWENCSECSYRFLVVSHGKLRFYTYPLGDVSAESAVIKGDYGGAEAQTACM